MSCLKPACARASLAQLVEQRTLNPLVVGSIPSRRKRFRLQASAAAAMGRHKACLQLSAAQRPQVKARLSD